ncbi:MAG: hypothetical protein QN137_10530 [Armatimonadota bacterium]|nr:hypothetical protein [Armatimonadota bacterium]
MDSASVGRPDPSRPHRDIHAEVPDGVPDHVVRTVTENARTLKFRDHGFERE